MKIVNLFYKCKPCKGTSDAKKMNGIRYHAKENDWVIATLGKNYDIEIKSNFFSEYGCFVRFFLVYAMKIAESPSHNKTEEKPIMSDFFFLPPMPIRLPENFYKVVCCGRKHKHLKSETDGELIMSFEKWIEEQKKKTENDTKNWYCQKSNKNNCIC